jgi:hypothetical protein
MSVLHIDEQSILHIWANLVLFRTQFVACPECGQDAHGKPHLSTCALGKAVSIAEAILHEDYQTLFGRR